MPVLGETLQWIRDPFLWARDRYDRYGPVSWTNLFGVKTVAILGPDAVEASLRNRDKALSSEQGWAHYAGPFLHRGIMLLDFEEHLYHRRIMQEAFTRDRLTAYLDRMNPVIEGVTREWSGRDTLSVYPAAKNLLLDVTTDIFAGQRLGTGSERIHHAFIDLLKAPAALLRFPVPGLRWSKGLAARKQLEQTFGELVREKRARQDDDLLSALCQAVTEDGERFADEDVVNHMILLLVGAHDTATVTITAMTYFLAKYPEWQERCRAESMALNTPMVSFADLDALSSVELVMKEALRLTAPLTMVGRYALKDTELLGYRVPKGFYVVPMLNFSHRMHEFWSSPEKFDPERFAENRREDKVHRFAWAPFGGGAHKCMGMHFGFMMVKAVMHQMLQRYTWSVEPGYEIPWGYKGMPSPKDGLPIQLRRRS